MKVRYITTTLPYVNADPHIGFALEILQADSLARSWRSEGWEVFFSTGTDEHGQKIYEAAQKAKEDTQKYTDKFAESFRNLKTVLNISNDVFIRTTDEVHKKAARELWERCAKNGDIYKKKYSAPYCVGCEKFLVEKDVQNGECQFHPGKIPQILEENNYFFAFSKYGKKLLQYLDNQNVIVPPHRLEEARQFVKNGLEDFSISREKSKMPWGISVPNDDEQVMYVWFDALTNYISTLGWPDSASFQKFWENGVTLQFAGKDQVRFQSLMWQAMLISAKIKTTDKVFYHGFITSGGQKMSKSLGNVIDPSAIVNKYGREATRYFLLRHINPTEDSDITLEKISEWYEANLQKGLGNLTARIMTLAEKYLTAKEARAAASDEAGARALATNCAKLLNEFRFNESMDLIWNKIGESDNFLTKEEPFKVVKVDAEKGKSLIEKTLFDLQAIALALAPFMPETSEKIISAIKENKKPENLFPQTQ